jgi:hypothetical protein
MFIEYFGWCVIAALVLYGLYLIFTHFFDPNDPSLIYRDLKLQKDNREIRLLYLEPGNWDHKIVCRLKVVGLDEKIKFTALSYAWREQFPYNTPEKKNGVVAFLEHWGFQKLSKWANIIFKDPRKRVIYVNDRPKEIGINLELALRHKREKPGGSTIALWADAICINQDEVEDRNNQVSNMRLVYRKAEKVEIWLGAERDVQGTDDDEKPNLKCRDKPTIAKNPREGKDEIWSLDHIQHPEAAPTRAMLDDQLRAQTCIDNWFEYNNRPKSQRAHMTPDYTMEFFTMIYKFSQEAFASCGIGRRKPLDQRIPFLQSATARGPTLEVFHEFMNRLWWNRLWVVQDTAATWYLGICSAMLRAIYQNTDT